MAERLRVKDKDTGHHRTIAASALPHGNYEVLKSAAVDPVTGDDVPPKYADKPVGTSGQKADTTKEKS